MARGKSKTGNGTQKKPPAKAKRRGLNIQPRDLEGWSLLNEVDTLDFPTFHWRVFPTDHTGYACYRRVRLYEEHGITQRIHQNVASTRRRGRLPTYIRLTKHGADVLLQETGQSPLRYARSDVPKESRTLRHRAQGGIFHIAMNDGCAKYGLQKPQWLLEYDPVSNAIVGAPMAQRFVLCHQFPQPNGGKITCWADRACCLTIPDKCDSQKLWHLALFIEQDMATESSSQLAGTKPNAGNGKLDGYAALLNAKAYRQHWPDAHDIRIMFVVPSEQRLQNVSATFRDHPIAKYVRLAVFQDMVADRILTAPVWRTVDGERKPILAIGQLSHPQNGKTDGTGVAK